MPIDTFAPRVSYDFAPAPTGDTTGARDADSMQALINAATAGTVIQLYPGVYIVDSPWVLKRGVALDGGSKYDTIVKMADGANLDAVIISEEWDGGNNASDAPVTIRNLTVDANGANNTGDNNGIILMSYWSTVENVQIKNCEGHGLMVSATESDDTEITNTLVETRIRSCDFRTITGNGIWVRDDSNTTQTVTDGFVRDCVFQNCDGNGVQIDSAAGWVVSGNHFYGVKKSCIVAKRAWETKITENYGETWGLSTAAGTYCFIDCASGQAIGSLVVANNNAFHVGGIDSGVTVRGINIQAADANSVNATVTGNILRGATGTIATNGIRVSNQGATATITCYQSANIVSGFDLQWYWYANGGTLNRNIRNRSNSTPSDVVRENFGERDAGITNVSPNSSGRLLMELVWYEAGETVTSIGWAAATTAGASLTHRWSALFSSARAKLAISADDTSSAWNSGADQQFTMTSPYVIPADGYYYHGLVVVGGQVPTMRGFSTLSGSTGKTPIASGYADTGLTDPASCPSTAAAITAHNIRTWTGSK